MTDDFQMLFWVLATSAMGSLTWMTRGGRHESVVDIPDLADCTDRRCRILQVVLIPYYCLPSLIQIPYAVLGYLAIDTEYTEYADHDADKRASCTAKSHDAQFSGLFCYCTTNYPSPLLLLSSKGFFVEMYIIMIYKTSKTLQ